MSKSGFFQTRSEKKQPAKRAVGARKTGSRSTKLPIIPVAYYHEKRCEACTFSNDCLKMKPSGAKQDKTLIYILGEAPGADEEDQGRQFVGRSGKMLRKYLPDESVCRFDNTIRNRPPKNRTPTDLEIECCRMHVVEEIEATQPAAILGVGGTALRWMIGGGSILLWRGRRLPVKIGNHKCWFYPIVHPSFLIRGGRDAEQHQSIFGKDIKRAFDTCRDPLPADTPVEVGESLYKDVTLATPVMGLQWVVDSLREMIEEGSVAIDLETNCLRPYNENGKILTMSAATESRTIVFPVDHPQSWWTEEERHVVKESIVELLVSQATKICHNAAFELEWFVYHFGRDILRSFRWYTWGDTQVASYCLDERKGGHDLDSCCLENLGFKLKSQSEVNREKLETTDLTQVMKYNALDSKYTFKLNSVMVDRLYKEGLTNVYMDQMRRVPAAVLTQIKGLHVDFQEVKRLDEYWTPRIDEIRQNILTCDEAVEFQEEHKRPYVLEGDGSRTCLELKFNDPKKYPELVNKNGKFSTDDSVFSSCKSSMAKMIVEYRATSKLKGTYIDPLKEGGKWIFPDKKVHAFFNTTRTTTGRLSSSEPNAQNYPKRKHLELRKPIIAPAGYRFVSIDYSQIEVRLIAMASQDPVLMKQVKAGEDIHAKYTTMLAELAPKYMKTVMHDDFKACRSVVKNAITFPFFYGSRVGSVARNLSNNKEGVVVSERIVQRISDVFWGDYKVVRQWQKYIARGYEQVGWVECLNGRRRHGPMTENELINSPIQGSASDLVVDAMVRLSQRSVDEDRLELQPILNIHDDLSFYLPEDMLEDCLEEIIRAMLQPTYEWAGIVPIGVEVSVGSNWAELAAVGAFTSDEL